MNTVYFFSKNPDRIPTPDSIFLKVRTESGQLTESRQTESGQTDTGQKIQAESGQQTDTGHDFPEIRTKTRQGQDTDSAVRRRLPRTSPVPRTPDLDQKHELHLTFSSPDRSFSLRILD